MNIRDIANQGSIGHTRDRATERAHHEKTVIIPAPSGGVRDAEADRATISDRGRDTLAAVEGLAERARNAGGDRNEIVSAAAARLRNGDLTSRASLEETARRIVEQGFRAG